jgi:hypothetical protein
MVDIGAHHSCWLLLQALFMIASVLMAASATATETMTNGVFIGTSLQRVFCRVSDLQNEPRLNGLAPKPPACQGSESYKNQRFKVAGGRRMSEKSPL